MKNVKWKDGSERVVTIRDDDKEAPKRKGQKKGEDSHKKKSLCIGFWAYSKRKIKNKKEEKKEKLPQSEEEEAEENNISCSEFLKRRTKTKKVSLEKNEGGIKTEGSE